MPSDFPLQFSGPVTEDQDVVFSFTDPWALDDLPSLSAGAVELEPTVRAGGRLEWRWFPDFHAGEVLLTLRHGGQSHTRLVEVDPNLAKLTRADYAALTSRLAETTRRIFALSSVQIALRHERRLPTVLAQLQLMRACFERLSLAVRAIARSPKKRLREVPVELPIELADVATPDALAGIVAPGNLLCVPPSARLSGPAAALAGRLRGHLPRTVVTAEREVTFDVPENRFVKHALERISGLLRAAAGELAGLLGNQDGLARQVARAYAPVVEQMRRETFDLIRLPAFAQVRAEDVDVSGLVTFKRRPDYRTVADVLRDLSLGLEPAVGAPLAVPVERTHRLYELWTTFETILALDQALGDETRDLSALVAWLAEDTSLAGLEDREVEVRISRSVRAVVQRSYRRLLPGSTGVGTYSHEMRPDLVIEVTPPDGGPMVVVLLDAKYRRSGLRQGLDDLHRYKDAIVTPELRRVVTGAYALAPGLADLSASFADPAWQGRHGFGVIPALPTGGAAWTARVVELVRSALSAPVVELVRSALSAPVVELVRAALSAPEPGRAVVL